MYPPPIPKEHDRPRKSKKIKRKRKRKWRTMVDSNAIVGPGIPCIPTIEWYPIRSLLPCCSNKYHRKAVTNRSLPNWASTSKVSSYSMSLATIMRMTQKTYLDIEISKDKTKGALEPGDVLLDPGLVSSTSRHHRMHSTANLAH